MFGVTKISVVDEVVLAYFRKAPSGIKAVSGILNAVAENGICVDMISMSPSVNGEISIAFTVMSEDVSKLIAMTSRLNNKDMVPLINSGNCKITVFGEQMQYTKGVAARALDELACRGCEVKLITTSDVDISLLVDHSCQDEAVSCLKEAFELL